MNRKMSGIQMVVLLTAMVLNGFSLSARAEVGPRGGPGDVPTPFTSNQKVELAEGETYTLIGRFVVREGNLWFNVDLDAHPWLANQKRKEFPFYRVSGTRVDLEPVVVRAEKVQAVMKADGLILERGDHPTYRIGLEVLEQPVFPDAAALNPGSGGGSCSCPVTGVQPVVGNPVAQVPSKP